MIVILVEGPGDKRAIPILAEREHGTNTVRCVDMKGKSNIVRRNRGFEDTIRRQHALGQSSFVVLVDGDVTSAPYRSLDEERVDLPRRAQAIADELGISVCVCWAVLELESWLVGGIAPRATYCRLRGVGRMPANTEFSPADPKKWLEDHLANREYGSKTQECLARRIDLEVAKRHNRSMRTFMDRIGEH
jgi:hypothetical protein